jgi:hypothetical protein
MDEKGLFIEGILNEHDEWALALLEALEQKSRVTGKAPLLWSSGALNYLIERTAVKSGGPHHIDRWWIHEGSLTPTPAEFRCQALPLKSISLCDFKTLTDNEPARPPVIEHVTQTHWGVEACIERLEDRADFREGTKAGRVFSSAVLEEMSTLQRSLGELQGRLVALIARGERRDETETENADVVTTEATTDAEPVTGAATTIAPEALATSLPPLGLTAQAWSTTPLRMDVLHYEHPNSVGSGDSAGG